MTSSRDNTGKLIVVAARCLFAAIVLVTATGAGALFVAWPTQTESRASIYLTVTSRDAVEPTVAQYAVQVAP